MMTPVGDVQKSRNDGGFLPRLSGCKSTSGFSLVEILAALAVLSILMVLAFQFVSRTSKIWMSVNSKIEQFREGRFGLESMVQRLGNATLDQYSGYEYQIQSGMAVPKSYGRRSELRFISGPASKLFSNSSVRPTHAVFFTAPLGITQTTGYARLPGLLNICGYYIEWNNQDPDRPSILPGTKPYRFRLMQFVQPAEQMALYSKTSTSHPLYVFNPAPGWQESALAASPTFVRPLANNVIALILLPALTLTDTSGKLSSDFLYDSESSNSNAALNQRNRMPPVMRVILYSIDEASAKKLENSPAMPDLQGNLFKDTSKLYPSSGDIGDLARFEAVLDQKQLNYFRHEYAVEMLPQPWSTQN